MKIQTLAQIGRKFLGLGLVVAALFSNDAAADPVTATIGRSIAQANPNEYQTSWIIRSQGREGTTADATAIYNKQIDSIELRFYLQNTTHPNDRIFFMAIQHCSAASRDAQCVRRGYGHRSRATGSFAIGGRAIHNQKADGSWEVLYGVNYAEYQAIVSNLRLDLEQLMDRYNLRRGVTVGAATTTVGAIVGLRLLAGYFATALEREDIQAGATRFARFLRYCLTTRLGGLVRYISRAGVEMFALNRGRSKSHYWMAVPAAMGFVGLVYYFVKSTTLSGTAPESGRLIETIETDQNSFIRTLRYGLVGLEDAQRDFAYGILLESRDAMEQHRDLDIRIPDASEAIALVDEVLAHPEMTDEEFFETLQGRRAQVSAAVDGPSTQAIKLVTIPTQLSFAQETFRHFFTTFRLRPGQVDLLPEPPPTVHRHQ